MESSDYMETESNLGKYDIGIYRGQKKKFSEF